MDEKKVCFITCVNDDAVYNESLLYLKHQHLPIGMKAEYLSIKDAESMTAGYNAAMQQSDAKYKIYLHQDVLLINLNTVQQCIEVFQRDQNIGLLGVAGCIKLPESGVWWQDEACVGTVAHAMPAENVQIEMYGYISQKLCDVQAIDGLFMAAQYDLPWREDLFKAWHFYDISQSMEFRRKGYRVVVPQQEKPWCLHDCDMKPLGDYEHWREVFLKEYGKV